MKKQGERFCEVCGVSSTVKNVVFNKATNMCLCEKHKLQYKKYGEFKDSNPRGIFDPNEIRILEDHAEIDTYDSYGNVVETYIIDLDNVKDLGDKKWRTVYKNSKPYMFSGNQHSEKIYFHRLVLPTSKQVDHISGDTRDNRKSNLREVDIQENMLNLQKKCTNTSGIRGVSYDSKRNKWKTDFTFKKQRYYLKSWPTIEQAVLQRYICEKYFLESFRNEANDSAYKTHIDNITDLQKEEVINYVCTKLNISKERVEEDLTKIKNWSAGRQIEQKTRVYSKF